jgi:hypothetical protein
MPANRVNHFAFISTGPSGGGWLSPCYWKNHQELFGVLRDYGYPNEAIYRLSEAGEWHQPGVGLATLENFEKIFTHLGKITKEDDYVFIAIIGHGLPDQNPTGKCAHLLLENQLLSASMLADLLKNVKAKHVTIALHPCFSGGFLDKLSGTHPDRVIVTSTAANQGNTFGWIESFIAALSIRGRKQGRCIKEVWEQTKQEASDECGRRRLAPETPQLDNEPLAAQRYLGNNGMPVVFSDDALEQLRKDNASLNLVCRNW